MRFLARLLLNGLAVIVAAYFVPGLTLSGPGAALIAGAALGLVNAFVRPLLLIVTFPFTLLTLGLFIFVVHAICLAPTARPPRPAPVRRPGCAGRPRRRGRGFRRSSRSLNKDGSRRGASLPERRPHRRRGRSDRDARRCARSVGRCRPASRDSRAPR